MLKFIVVSLEERQQGGAGEQEDQRSIGPGGPLRAGQGNNVLEVNQEERQHLDAGEAGESGNRGPEDQRFRKPGGSLRAGHGYAGDESGRDYSQLPRAPPKGIRGRKLDRQTGVPHLPPPLPHLLFLLPI